MKSFLLFFLSCVFVVCNVNNVTAQCNDHILVSSTNVCQGESLTFTLDNQSFGSSSYTWYVDDISQNTTGNSFLYQFNSTGVVEIKYEVNNSCKDSVLITVNSLPNASFTFDNNNQCSPVLVNFTNTTSGGVNPYTYTWFENGNSFSALQSPNRNFDEIANGTINHPIQLTVQDANGCTDQVSQTVNVKGRPDARIGDATIDEPSFIRCSNASSFSVLIVDSSTTNNSNYHIDWSDGTTPYDSAIAPNNLLYTYTNLMGYDTLVLTVTGNNNCISTRDYILFNGIQPVASLGSPTSLPTIVCADYSVDFPITLSNVSQNTNGTIYIIYFDDGTPNDTLYHPITDSLYTHNFTKSSCGNSAAFGGAHSNAFSLRMKAYNACSNSTNDVAPIRLGHPPIPGFTHQSQVCVNTNISFTNDSDSAFYNNNGNCYTSMKQKWIITPSTGVVFNSSDSLATLDVQFTQNGTYDIKMVVWNKCASSAAEGDFITHQVCVLPEPISTYNIGTNQQSDTIGCAPFLINNITNNSNTVTGSCFETYDWNITTISSNCTNPSNNAWIFINSSDTSETPQIQFNEPGVYELELFINNICAVNSSFKRMITVRDKPAITLSSLLNVCQLENFSPTVTNFDSCYSAVTSWQWTATTNGSVEFSNQQNPGIVSFTTAGSKTIEVEATNICGITTESTTLSINTLPTPPSLVGNAPCFGDVINIAATGVSSNVDYLWTFPDGLGFVTSNISRPNSTLNMGGDYLLTVTDPTTNCFDTVSVFVPVYPLPNITIAASNQNPCVNTPITLTASGATSYVWQWQGGNSSNNPLSINPTQDSTYAVIGTDDNNCISNANIFISTIPLPIVNAGANMFGCFQNPAISIQLTGTGSPNGGIWSAIGNIGTNTISSSGLFTPNQVMSDIELVYTYTNSNTTCENSDIMEIDVILPDVADAGNNTDVCVGSSVITLSGNYNNTGTWRQSGSTTEITTFDPTTVGTSYFVYTVGIESCITHDTMKITVNDLPNVTITTSDLTPCASDSIILVASGATNYSWLFSTGIISTDSLFVNPSQSTTYTVVGTDNNGCKTADSITINPIDLPIVNAGNDTSACFQTPTISMQLTGTQDTGMPNDGTWSAVGDISPNTISTNGVFSPNGIASNIQLVYTYTDISTGCVSSDTLEIDVIAPTIAANVGNDTTFCAGDAAITFINIGNSTAGTWRSLPSNIIKTTFNPSMAGTYLFSFTLGAGSCETKDTLQITVNPLPFIFVHNDFPICRIDSLIDLSENIVGGIWSGTGITNTTTGEFNPSQVNVSSTTLNYTYTDGNGCTNDDNITINVNDITEAIAGSDTSFCNITTDIQLAGFSPTAAGGIWSGTEMQQDSQGIFNSNGVSDTYTAYYTFINNDGCKSVDSIEITVNNLIKPELQNDTAVCINTNNLTLSVTPADGTWTMNNGTFNNLFTTDTSGIYEIIYEIGSGTTCESSDTLEIRVEDLPQITLANDSSVCADAGTIDLSETPNGGTWLGIGITNTSTGAFEVSNGTQTLTYTYIESQVFYGNTLECSNKDSVTITVNLLPIVTVPDTIVYCLVDYDITLPTGSPLGGTWVGTGITAPNQFNPTTAGGVGNYTATYIFIDGNTCESSDNMHIRVEASDSVSAGFNDTICITQTADTLKHFYPTIGGTWSGNGVASNGFFNPVQAGAGLHILTFTYGNGSCQVAKSKEILVVDTTVIDAGLDQTACLNEPAFLLTGFSPTGGIWTGINIDSIGIFTPTSEGSFLLKYTFAESVNGCISEDTKTITINALPIPEAQSDTTLCAVSTTINLPSGTANVNGTSIWTGSNAIIPNTNLSINPSFIGAGNSAALYFTFTDIHNCSVMDSMELSVIAADSINAGINDTVCINAGLETLVGYPAGGTWSGNGIINDSIFNNINDNTPAAVYTLTYTFDNGNGGCEVSANRIRTIRALPVMTAALDTLVCIEAPAFSMFGFSPITDLLGIGIWSGNGITNENIGIFESDTAGIGQHNLTYVYTDFVGCVDSNNRTIDVVDLPIIDTLIGADTLCNQPFGVQYVGHQDSGNPNDGVWSGTNMAQNGIFTPNGVGDFMVYYCYTDNNTCERCDSTIITVIPAEPIEAGVADTICIDEGIYLLTAEFPTGGFWSGSTAILNTIDGTFDPLIATSGWHTVTYTYGSGTCLVSDTTGVYVRDLAFVDAGAAENACETDADFTIFGFSPIGGTWSGTGITNNSGTFSPTTVNPGTYPITYFYTDSITGCDTSRIKNVFVHPLSQPDFTFDTTLCINIPYTITDLSTNTTQWFWDFGDGSTYTTQNPTHTYSQTGNFIIKLTATSVHGCKDSTTLTVFVTEIPTASFTKDTTDGCTPLPVNFTNTSTGDLMEYSWNLGNNSPLILNLNPPTTIYEDGTQDTTYTITLTTSNLCGSADFVDSVLVYPKPQIIFAPDVNSGCTPLTVDLVNNTSGNPDNFYWSYGDGNLDTISNQNTHDHTFYTDTIPTVYTITLIAENECGLDTATTFVTVNPVTVESFFNTDTSIGCQPFTTNFTNYSTQGTTVIWNFGDGSSADTINSTSHTFTQVGTFKVVQYVTNGCGYDSTFTWITVLPSPVATFTNQNNICEDAALTFTNTTANTIGQTWNFGDGTTSTNSVATHIYTTAGTYQVTLTVFNNSSQCPGFKTKTITILPKPIAIFTPSVTNGCEDLVVQFTDASIGNITGYSYNFGDNNSVVTASPTHTYLDSGVYIVNYFVVDANTCVSDIDSQNIVVYPVPTSDFTFAILDSCTIPTNVQFTNLSQGATGYEWTVDNSGNILATNNPMVTYNSEGIYNIELKAISIHGCRDSSQQIFELFAPPVAVWNVDQPNYCQPSTVTFTNLSTGNGLSHFYNFDDSSGTNTPSPVHLYTDIGTYNPTYFITDNNGCSSDTITQTLYVRPVPTSDFAFAILDSCAIPAPVAFTNLSQGATNYEWRFGNGQITYNTNPTEIYNQEGNYTVELVAENIHGCRDSSQQIFELFAPPVAVWNVDQANSCLPSEVIFTNNSIGNGLNHFYNFGNGNTSTTPSPTHIFTAVGTYNSTYFVIDSNSCLSDTLDEIIEVYPVPTSDFTFKILDSCEIPTLVGFTNLSQGATNYEWRLDNGQILGNVSPTTYYNQAGTYTVELVAKNSFSCRDSSQQTFEIFAPPTGFVSYEQLDTCEPSLVQFYPNASNATDYFWNFGNGQTSFIPEPIATYQTVGIYDVSLILGVNNICFDTLTYNDFIQVFPRPFANFVHLDTMTDGRFKGVVKFINTSIGANQYVWDFADNATSNLENPTYAFRSNGLFDVQLIATNSYNCSDDTIISVRPDFFGTLEIPNIMAPGFGTGEDRFFIPKGIGLETYLVEVFDKQGTRIWYSDEIDTDGRPTGKWDGMFQGQELPQGAYVWKVKAQFINGSTVHRTGTVTIVR
jgi:PKD repeat protein